MSGTDERGGAAVGGRPDERWWADDRFWEDLYEFIFPPEHVALGPAVAQRAAALLALGAGASVLDLGCGAGRVAVPLAHLGLRVTGVDTHAGYLRRAQARAQREGVALTLVQADMSQLTFREAFDGALCVFNSFGYFADPRRDQLVLDGAREALRPGGRFLLETAHRDGVAGTLAVRELQAPDGRRWRDEPRFDPATGILESRWTLTSAGGTRTFVSRTRPYAAAELDAMLRRAGFREVRLQRDLDGGAPSAESFTLVAVAVR